jgi:DNA-directed RNA polymerase subunit K/omega
MQHGPEFDSLFRFIVVVSQRAEQLINGARVRSESRHVKPTLQALDDVNAGLVGWRVLTQEELDAQRQAIVEQFRAEVGADRIQAEAQTRLPDVLPTGPVEAREEPVEVEPVERDDELSRLQRLLGLGDRGPEPAEEEGEPPLDTDDDESLSLDLDEAEPVLIEDTEDESVDLDEDADEDADEDSPRPRPFLGDDDVETFVDEEEEEDVYIDGGELESDDDADE